MQESNIEIHRPKLEGIPVYRDGRIDHSDQAKRYGSFGLRVVGYGLAKVSMVAITALDEMVARANGHEAESW